MAGGPSWDLCPGMVLAPALVPPFHWILRSGSQADKLGKYLDRVNIKSAFSSNHFLSRIVWRKRKYI